MKMLTKIICIFLSMAICIPAFAVEKVYFVYTDPAGTPLAMTNNDGAIVWKAEYKPFGEIQSEIDFVLNNKKFVGKEQDSESGLYYFGARYMEARIGRFMSPDPSGPVLAQTGMVAGRILENPQMLNLYAYALNNPYKYSDPDGRWPEWIHNRLIDLAFSSGKYDLSKNVRYVLKAASRYVDRDANQGPDTAYQHAMRSPNQTPEQAELLMNKFINDKVSEYKMRMSKGEKNEAYKALGYALHPIMDSTSPPHIGFQEWGGNEEVEGFGPSIHFVREQFPWTKNMEMGVERMRGLFDSANE